MSFRIVIDKKNYTDCIKKKARSAVRAISFIDDKLIMVKSDKYGELKFPGGGIEPSETELDSLVREVKEETGLDVDENTIVLAGIVREVRKSTYDFEELFDHTSYYYFVDVLDNGDTQQLQGYEIEYGYRLVLVSIDDAIAINQRILDVMDTKMIPWVERELMVLKKIKEIKDGVYS